MSSSSSSTPGWYFGWRPVCDCCCDCYETASGDRAEVAQGTVNAMNGTVNQSAGGLHGGAFNIPFGTESSYSNNGSTGGGTFGESWISHDLAGLDLSDPAEISYTEGALQTEVFVPDGSGTAWNPTYFNLSRLTLDATAGLYTMTLKDGSRRTFDSTSGRLTSLISPAGAVLDLTYATGSGDLATVSGTHDGHTVIYSYVWDGPRVSSVTQTIDAENVHRTEYSYYTGGNLRQITTSEWRSGAWVVAERKYFTYYPDEASSDNSGLLCHVLGDLDIRRMESAGLNPDTASRSQFDAFAGAKYYYDSLSRVQKVQLNGNAYEWSFEYTPSTYNGDTPNDWTSKTIVTCRGSENVETIYFNRAGSVLLRAIDEFKNATFVRTWYPVCQQFDETLRVVRLIAADAISSVNEATAELVSLHANEGLIRHRSYHAASGRLHEEWVTKGTAGTGADSALLRTTTWIESSSGSGVWVPETVTEYRDGVTPSGLIVTSFAYTWSGFRMTSRTTSVPVVSTDENGTDLTYTIAELFDSSGWLSQRTDESGVVTTFEHDYVTGSLKKKTIAPSSLNLITDYALDDEGRVILEKGPVHSIDLNGAFTPIRRCVWTYYRDPEKQRISFPGYIVLSSAGAELTSHCVGPVTIERGFVASGSSTGDGYADTLTAVWEYASLPLPDTVYPQADWRQWQRRHFTAGGVMDAELLYHLITDSGSGTVDTHFALTAYAHDAEARVYQVTTPGGTIQKTVFNALGLAVELYTGTTTGNLFLTTLNTYGHPAALLTGRTVFVDGNTDNDRVWGANYDWRHRTFTSGVYVKLGDATTLTHLITEHYYDNRDLPIETREYDGTAATQIAQNITRFDARGRTYRTETFRVVPGESSAPTDFLYDDTWYDPAGRVLASRPAGSETFQMMGYDDAGRATHSYTGYSTLGLPSSGAPHPAPVLSTSVIMEQTDLGLDAAGNVILTTQRQRYDDATGNNVLQNSTTQPKARVSYIAAYPDALGRTQATVNAGTNANAAWTRPFTIPAGTDILLVNTTAYNPAGEPFLTTDPMGAQVSRTWDAAGRLTREIHIRVPGQTVPAIDRQTDYVYNSDGNLTKLIARNNTASGLVDQITEWVYGVTTAGGSILNSNLLVAKKIYPDSTGGSDVVTYTYNGASQVLTMKDQAGLVHTYSYDQLGRQTQDAVTAWGSSAADRSIEKLKTAYNSRGLVVTAGSYGTATAAVNEVTFGYNGWRQVTSETQAAGGVSKAVGYGYAPGTAGTNTIRRTSMTYPSGQVMNYQYAGTHGGQLSRVSKLQDGSTDMVGYTWLGLGTPVDVNYPVPACHYTFGTSASHYDGLDRFGRPVVCKWLKGSDALVEAKYGYDRSSNRQWRFDAAAHAASVTTEDQWYNYDGLYEIRSFQRGALTGTYPNFSGINPVSENQNWNYDAMRNWRGFTSGALSQTREFNKVNEITSITGPAGVVTPQYDPTGNMTTMPAVENWTTAQTLTWDAWNRLVKVSTGSTTIAEYTYDALFRRISKKAVWNGSTPLRRFYYTDQWQIAEEYLDADTSLKTRYWYGIRDLNDIARGQFYDGSTLLHDYYALRETMNVVALMESADQSIAARFRYDAFGNSVEMGASWNLPTNPVFWPLLFHAHYRDYETRLYEMRFRYYHPGLGVWLSRDPVYQNGEILNFTKNNPVNAIDILGLVERTVSAGGTWFKITSRVEIKCDGTVTLITAYPAGAVDNISLILGGWELSIETPRVADAKILEKGDCVPAWPPPCSYPVKVQFKIRYTAVVKATLGFKVGPLEGGYVKTDRIPNMEDTYTETVYCRCCCVTFNPYPDVEPLK